LLLEKYGFYILFFEDVDFDSQIKLNAETKKLLSLHGANMINVLFMPEYTTVIELMNKKLNNLIYFNLS